MAMEKSDKQDHDDDDLYEKGRSYWERIAPNIDGMLGGWTNINTSDVDESRKLLRILLKPIKMIESLKRPLRCLDCGAGIGRVSKYVLSKFFDEIDLLEQNETFVLKAKDFLGDGYHRVKHTYIQGMQEFAPIDGIIYDCIWGQWVYGYLTDEDLILFLEKCLRILDKQHGFIVVKDNVSKDEDSYVDDEDGFVTRTEAQFLSLFSKVPNLIVKDIFRQKRMPKELLPVKMFVLSHHHCYPDKMAHIEKFKRSFELLKLYTTQSPKISAPLPVEKSLISPKRQDNIIDKKECLKQCDYLVNVLISIGFRNHPDFNKFLSQSIELLFHLCNNDDTDIRNVVNETFDKLIGNLIEFNSNRLLSELCKGITKFSSNRALRLSLTKFSEICHRIRSNKYRAFTTNLYSSFVTILIDSPKDELIQEALYTAICKIYPLLTPYATEREIFDLMNAYLINLSSSLNSIRRYSSLSIVILCDSARKPDHYFNVALNHVANLMSTSTKSIITENKDYLLTGIFMLAKCSFSKLAKYLDPNEHPKLFDSLLKNLSYIYQQMILTIKYAINNILIIATLEALVEFFNALPEKIFQMFTDLCEEEMEFKHISSFRSSAMKSVINDSLMNLENLNDEFEDETFEKAGIFFSNAGSSLDLPDDVSEASESLFANSLIENTGSIFDHESEIDTKSIENKTPEFDLSSEASSLNTTSHKCPNSPFDISSSFDLIITENHLHSIDFDDYNLGPLFSFEYAGKLICLKYLLKVRPGQLMTDAEVRVAIKGLSLSCIASIVQHCPRILFEKLAYKKTATQLIRDIFSFSTHSDPNIRGHMAMIVGKYLKRALSYSFSYDEFLAQNNPVGNNNNELSLDFLLNLLEKFLFDSSSITIRQTLISLQQFLPILISHNEIRIIQIFNLIHQLIRLKDNSYWLIKIELITLFARISFPHLKHMEFMLNSITIEKPLLRIHNHLLKHVPISKLIIEEILFHFLFDSDHRVRQATLNLLTNFIDNICLNNYVFQNDCINLLVMNSILSNDDYLNEKSKYFNGKFPSLDLFQHSLDGNPIPNSHTQSNNDDDNVEFVNFKKLIIESNVAYFVKRFFYELRHRYYCKQSLSICLNSLNTLARLYPPDKHPNGWLIEPIDSSQHNSVEMIMFLIEILTKNPMMLNDLSLQQNLAELIMCLIESVCLACFQQLQLQNQPNDSRIESTGDLYRMISSDFAHCIETFFLYLYKIIVIYSAINEDNPLIFTTFIHNLYTRNESISAMIKKHSTSFFDMNKDKNLKESATVSSSSLPFGGNKATRRRETYAYDSMSFRLFEILKNHRHHHRKSITIMGRSDKSSYLNTMLTMLAKLLEFTSSSFLCNHLEDMLIYLKMIFYMNPSATIASINQLIKCIFEINYISLFIEIFNHNGGFRIIDYHHHQQQSCHYHHHHRRDTKSKLSIDLNSLHNICFVIPYMKFNDLPSIGGSGDESRIDYSSSSSSLSSSLSYLNWLRKWIEYKYIKIMNSDVTRGTLEKNSGFCLKKFLTTKIQCFEPLVIQSMKHYAMSNDTKCQSIILDLFVQLIQFHINYSLLDSEKLFVGFIMKQFEHLETIYDSGPFEILMKHVFHFLATLSTEHYIIDEDMVSIPKIIQLCDNLIANGHQCLAIDGLRILIEHIFYSDLSRLSSDNINSSTLINADAEHLQLAIETQKEVIVAYCFKLLNQNGTFHLLALILQHYKHRDPIKWNDLSQQILDIIIGKLLSNQIRIDSREYFDSLQSLLAILCPNVLSHLTSSSSSSSSLEIMLNEYSSYQNSQILFKHWLPKILVYLKIILMDMNETVIMKEMDRIKTRMNIIILNPINNCPGDCVDKIDSEDVVAYFLLNLLQKIIMEIDLDVSNGNYHSITLNDNHDHQLVVHFLRYYHMILVSIFQSGFYPRLTRSATILLRQQPKSELSLNNETFDLKMVNEIFLKITKFYPLLTISWLNFLYILNYDKLAKILSKCIDRNKVIDSNGNNQKSKQTSTTIINWEILKRSSLILLCDYLSENLENVEFLSWFIINYLHEIIEHCHEMPIKEFINGLHRKPVSSGLLLQVISSKFDDELVMNTNGDDDVGGPLMAQKILYCLERSHNRQNIALIMFLLERYICNIRLSLYYKCCKYAESIIINRLNLIYDYKSRKSTKQPLLFSFEDFDNLLRIVKHTSYNKLYFTLKMIRVRFYDSMIDHNNVHNQQQQQQQQQQRLSRKKRHHQKNIKDPLRLKRISIPDMDKNWFTIMINNQLSQRQPINNTANILNSIDRLTNNDIIDLIFSSKFSLKNFIIILKLIVEKQLDNNSNSISSSIGSNKFHKHQSFTRPLELAKFIVPIYCQFLQSILERFPLIYYFNNNGNNNVQNNQNIRTIYYDDVRTKLLTHNDFPFYTNLLQSFSSSFAYFIEHLSLFDNYSVVGNDFQEEESSTTTTTSTASLQSIIIHLTIVYSTLLYDEQNRQNYQNALNILLVIENFLDNRNLFVDFGQEKYLYLQLTLINAIHYTFKHHYSLSMADIFINVDLTNLTTEFDITVDDYEKLITMFHSLENNFDQNLDEGKIPPLYHRMIQRIVLNLCRLPNFNSLIYIPYNLLNSQNPNIWNGIQSLTNISIMASQFLCETETFKQFLFRIANIGFVNRRQFEEIWMTLLGVFSESFSLISQYSRQGYGSGSMEELSEYIILTKLVIMAITNLLYNANTILSNNHYHSDYSISDLYDNNIDVDKEHIVSFGEKYEQIHHIIHRKFHTDEQTIKLYNDPILNRSFYYKFKSIHEFHFDSVGRNQSESTSSSPISSPSTSTIPINNNVQTSIDLYSCIQFLIDFYAQQIQPYLSKNAIYFPIVTEMAKSTLILSELFVDRNQYRRVLELFIDLQKIVDNYDDEILGQFIGTGFCKFYAILGNSDEQLERQKKHMFERNFKEFFLPTRIHSINAIEYLIDGQIVKSKDLQPLLDYIAKHLSTEHIIPSSYCREYVDKLVRISFKLIDSYSDIVVVPNNQCDYHREKIMKGLIKLIAKDINIRVLNTLIHCLEKLIRHKKLNMDEANLLRNLCLKRMNNSTTNTSTTITTNRSCQIQMLSMIVNTTYLVGTTNFDLETNDDNDDGDELFKTMEKLSIIFEPLRWCNSLDARIICQVFGYFLAEFFPAQDILNKCIGEFLSKQQNHYKYLIEILYMIYSKLQIDCQQNDTAEDWVILSLSSFTQLVPISHALWALTCFLICASHNHWIRSCYYYFQNRFGKFSEHDKRAFFTICNNFYNEIKSDDNKMSFIKTFQKAACVPNSPYIEVLQYLCDDNL
ncbi:hypothetical protein HUG17_3266 [Dermatophagoides farinae]|uniref:Uncharacterized protein n=1 Tax=Dermatophagoides farinae TaxID=6954 RepID=A0A9D4SEZ6_DERFA|nr:hypothetical protein HUG17_3266 [Dermatophagoides farinae]